MYLSAISISEIAIKHDKGNLRFNRQNVSSALATLNVEVLPCSSVHAQRLFRLPLHHKDPFFRLYEGVEVLW